MNIIDVLQRSSKAGFSMLVIIREFAVVLKAKQFVASAILAKCSFSSHKSKTHLLEVDNFPRNYVVQVISRICVTSFLK
jgi:hypothetical protein